MCRPDGNIPSVSRVIIKVLVFRNMKEEDTSTSAGSKVVHIVAGQHSETHQAARGGPIKSVFQKMG